MDFGGSSLKLFIIISIMIIQTKCKLNNSELFLKPHSEQRNYSTTRKQENLKNDHGIVRFRPIIDLEMRRETQAECNNNKHCVRKRPTEY